MFQGRYGMDKLNRAIMAVGLVLVVVNLFIPYTSYARNICSIASGACFVIAVVRMFSRNFTARGKENTAYMKLENRLKAFFSGSRARVVRHTPTFEERRKYKYFYCAQCAQRLRVPRGKGKLRVTCTRCGYKFDMKS